MKKAFRLLGDELPYGVAAVMIDKWEENDQGARIFATLIVNREKPQGHRHWRKKGSKLREISRDLPEKTFLQC